MTGLGLVLSTALSRNISPTPPMGWMDWEIFRCQTDCVNHNESCINEYLFKTMADRLEEDGYVAAGYTGIHIDDCWSELNRTADGKLAPNATRFPSGIKSLADYVHSKGAKLGIYTAEGEKTCGKYPGSHGFEQVDAETFASWGIDYLKDDGCGNAGYFHIGYPAMGDALVASGRDIVFSCEWPAYMGGNESARNYSAVVDAHCNTWRITGDIQCHWYSLMDILRHLGDNGEVLKAASALGGWNDPDMLIVGNGKCITTIEAQTQMAVWSIVAAPLIMGNDLRIVPDDHKAILLNKEAIAVNQDPLGEAGLRTYNDSNKWIWERNLTGNAVAFALFNPSEDNQTISVDIPAGHTVLDIWAQKDLGPMKSYSSFVPPHGTAFIKVSPQ
eukprot:TRINITY_DN3988_c6_g1_i1.p1 TRINITY_DN3988_c6_g1~~TRINITY_DN3988_c6_g1_i1.p1  ORF type:complete len:387 (+),score=62.28 TRINITY_DN3988_c6_g1_i1:45-1205(+)